MLERGESLGNERIADYYTALLHVSGADLTVFPHHPSTINDIYTGGGKLTGLALSGNDRVVFNNYVEPVGWDDLPHVHGHVRPHGQGATEWLDAFFPINSIMLTVTNDNPSHRIAGTKWVQEASGVFLVGEGAGSDQNAGWDDEAYTYQFSPGWRGTSSGDLVGEYCVKLTDPTLPSHTHDVNSQTITIGSLDTELQFGYYFGPTVNPRGSVEEKVYTPDNYLLPDIASRSLQYFLGQDSVQAFQNNANFGGHEKYRSWVIQDRHNNGYRYTDADFDPKIANHSLEGWGGSVVGGPGWGGLLQTSKGRAENISEFVFIDNSPRPVGVPWPSNNFVVRESAFEPRDSDRVHPGVFGPSALITARNIIVNVLGQEEAAIALEGVIRLKELDETVTGMVINQRFTQEQIPGDGVKRNTKLTGETVCHNNILPSYGVYFWRRVPMDYVIPEAITVLFPDPIIYGCMDPTADNFNPRATEDNGSCEYLGCMDPTANNFNPRATVDNGSCDYPEDVVKPPVRGCMDSNYDNFNPLATVDNGSCKNEEIVVDGPEITDVVVRPLALWEGTITQNRKNLDLRQWALDRGWDGNSPAKITLKSNKYLWSDNTSKPGLTIGSFPNGLQFINKGYIMGRGGDGGSYGATYQKGGSRPPNGGYFTGWNGGDAIKITSRSVIKIKNKKYIAGGGGGGAGGGTGQFGGGGGGAGGGKGGIGAKEDEGIYETGGGSGSLGGTGGNGGQWLNRRHTGKGANAYNGLYGSGGQAGGGGSGGFQQGGNDPHGGGGGGGRKLTSGASGGSGGKYGGGNGGSGKNKGQSVKSDSTSNNWGAAAGGGGWGADGGNQRTTPRVGRGGGLSPPKGGKGGKAINSVSNSNYSVNNAGGQVYGDKA